MKLTFERLVTLIVFLAIFAMAARISVETDTWWHLRAGQWILENQRFPDTDQFSYTRFGEEWHYPGWLVEVPMVWIYQVFGPGGLNIWTAIMVCLAFGFIWKTLEGNVFLKAFIMILAAATSGVYWAARPYLVTFVLMAAYIWIFEKIRKDEYRNIRKYWVWLALMMVVWANSHAGFFGGFLIWGVYLLDGLIRWWSNRQDSRIVVNLIITGLIIAGSVCINPYGVEMLAYPFKTIAIKALQDYIQEWQTPNFHLLSVQPFAWLIILLIAALGFSKRRMLVTDILLTSGFMYMGLMAGRNIALFGLVAPMVITRHISPMLEDYLQKRNIRVTQKEVTPFQNRLNWVILLLLILAVFAKITLIYPIKANEIAFKKGFPIEEVNYLRQSNIDGNLFNSYNWGGYLLWHLPEYPVFIDGRTDLYNDEIISEWIKVVRGDPGWEDVLDAWDVNVILIEPGMRVTSMLDESWDLVFKGDLAQVWVKR